jgi:hypothetical protein
LYCSVKALYKRIVVGSSDAAVADGGAVRSEEFLKLPPVLWAVVGLDHVEVEACVGFAALYYLCGECLAEHRMVLTVTPTRVDVHQGVQIRLAFGGVVVQMDCVCLDKIAWLGGCRTRDGWTVVALPLPSSH